MKRDAFLPHTRITLPKPAYQVQACPRINLSEANHPKIAQVIYSKGRPRTQKSHPCLHSTWLVFPMDLFTDVLSEPPVLSKRYLKGIPGKTLSSLCCYLAGCNWLTPRCATVTHILIHQSSVLADRCKSKSFGDTFHSSSCGRTKAKCQCAIEMTSAARACFFHFTGISFTVYSGLF